MSLLMDALKRAEKARQAEAERAKAEGRGADKPELSLDPIEDSSVDGSPAPEGAAAPRGQAGTDTEDSLELTPPDVRREIEGLEDPVFDDTGNGWREPAPQQGARGRDDSMSLSLDYGDIPIDDTGSTLPSMRAAERSVQDYFDGTHSVSLSMDKVQEAIGAEGDRAPPREEGGTTVEGDTTARRRAQSVLDARAVAPSTTGRNVVLVLLLLVFLGGIGGGAFVYRDRLMELLDGRPTVVARVPPAGALAPAPAPAPAPRPQVLAAEEREALLRAAEAARVQERERAAAEAAARAAAEAAAPKPAAPAIAEAPAVQRPAPAAEDQVPLAQVLQQASASRGPAGAAPSLRIAKRRAPSRTHARLMQGYEAFTRGDDELSRVAYQEVLAREPRNRDALLGLAALAMRAGDYDAAAGHYVEVLRRHPRDATAQAGLIALQENLDPLSGESRVKSLLAESPDDPYLHFSLGNLYAEQQRWPEAQQAYFDAYRLDDGNPDYAFNLAVSLDRLAQRRPALAYYRRAGELAAQRPAGFEPADAARRIAALEAP